MSDEQDIDIDKQIDEVCGNVSPAPNMPVTVPENFRRGRGRPPGSKNKPKDNVNRTVILTGAKGPKENDVPKAWWLAQFEGERVYDAMKGGEHSNSGLYVCLYDYDWGPDRKGVPMKGRLLGIAPFYERKDGNITWRGRQRKGKDKSARNRNFWQFDLCSIKPESGYRLSDAIRRVLTKAGITEEVSEEAIQQKQKAIEDKEMEDLMREGL